ncbi:hypothetical protein CCUS01_12042 [Colletotrichum cuscutae]|uniref:Uncharacterized protein n=1 Tax=Colletotrichum cuscutae TaxID=1209917 RepID=A0AAI9TXV2_9PEZI|nr:hypothetical protein CCUS01_12042 [Colletotrichum cuscutae]
MEPLDRCRYTNTHPAAAAIQRHHHVPLSTTHPTPRRWLPLRSVALGTAVAGIRCDVASCFHSYCSTYGSILEASKKAKKEFTLLRRCSKFEVCSSFANQNSRKFSPPPGIQRQGKRNDVPWCAWLPVPAIKMDGGEPKGTVRIVYLLYYSQACIPSQRPAVARVPDGDGDCCAGPLKNHSTRPAVGRA